MGRKPSAQPTKWPRRGPVTGMRLPDDLIRRAKHHAIDSKSTLREVVELALKTYLDSKGVRP